MNKINLNSLEVIKNNNLLFTAFENRLIIRICNIFDKYKIPINNGMLKKNMEENLINSLNSSNEEIIEKYVELINKYEKIIQGYILNKTDTKVIKSSTMNFINRISSKNKHLIDKQISNNFIEYINSIIYVYDNHALNVEIINRINTDIKNILNEFNRNNYNFVIESINMVIKNIINGM